MLTWQLWRALKNPPRDHPLYRRFLLRLPTTDWRQFLMSFAGPVISMCLPWMVCCGLISTPIGVGLLSLVLILLTLNGSYYGLQASFLISSAIARERQRGTHTLLSLTPIGSLGADWLISLGSLHRDQALERRSRRHRAVLGVIWGFAALVLIGSIVDANSVHTPEVGLIFAYIIAATFASYLDYVQSVILGSLTGILAPTIAQGRLDAQLSAAGSFLFIQTATYALTGVLGFVLLPALYKSLNFTGWLAEAEMLVLRFLLFYALRETAIALLWRMMIRRVDAARSEVETVIQMAL